MTELLMLVIFVMSLLFVWLIRLSEDGHLEDQGSQIQERHLVSQIETESMLNDETLETVKVMY
jgi:hypothetical protein